MQAIQAALYGGMQPAQDGYDKERKQPYLGMLTIRTRFLRQVGWTEPTDSEVADFMGGYNRVLNNVGGAYLFEEIKAIDPDGNAVTLTMYHEWADALREKLKERFALAGIVERQRWILLGQSVRVSSTE